MGFWVESVQGMFVQQDDSDQDDDEFKVGWSQVPIKYRWQIAQGIQISRAMVSRALKGLEVWAACNDADRKKVRWQGETGDLDLAADVDNGLHKYFHLRSQSLDKKIDGSVVRGIQRAFGEIRDGLDDANCTIQLWSFVNKSIWAAVKEVGDKRPGTAASRIRSAFGFTDEYGHVPWKELGGPILLSTSWLKRPVDSDKYSKQEEIARTLVHEASHRYAGTRDILYKDASFGAELKKVDAQLGGRTKQPGESSKDFDTDRMLNRQLVQEQSALASITSRAIRSSGPEKMRAVGIKKDLISMAPKQGKPAIAPELWLENADSYAYFARRVWKRFGSPLNKI